MATVLKVNEGKESVGAWLDSYLIAEMYIHILNVLVNNVIY